MSVEADPDNPAGAYFYEPVVRRDWYVDAIEQAQKDPAWSGDNFSRARIFSARRVDR